MRKKGILMARKPAPRMPFTDSGLKDKFGNALSGAIDSAGKGWIKIGHGSHIVPAGRQPVNGEQLKELIRFKRG